MANFKKLILKLTWEEREGKGRWEGGRKRKQENKKGRKQESKQARKKGQERREREHGCKK